MRGGPGTKLAGLPLPVAKANGGREWTIPAQEVFKIGVRDYLEELARQGIEVQAD